MPFSRKGNTMNQCRKSSHNSIDQYKTHRRRNRSSPSRPSTHSSYTLHKSNHQCSFHKHKSDPPHCRPRMDYQTQLFILYMEDSLSNLDLITIPRTHDEFLLSSIANHSAFSMNSNASPAPTKLDSQAIWKYFQSF